MFPRTMKIPYDKTTSEMRGCLPRSYRWILDEARMCKHNTYKHTIPYMKFKFKLLHISLMYYNLKDVEPKRCFKGITLFQQKRYSYDKNILLAIGKNVFLSHLPL
jgi:hypothetical protein